MDIDYVTAFFTGFIALLGLLQLEMLKAQWRHTQLGLIEEYRRQWDESADKFGVLVLIGRSSDEYYQLFDREKVDFFSKRIQNTNPTERSSWALNSSRDVFVLLGDVCVKILQGQIDIGYIYPIIGDSLLRHSRPLRVLLDSRYAAGVLEELYEKNNKHINIRREVQDWLIYHDGVRRRCLILIDLLWAEAARLEDLPPSDLKSAANAKFKTGKENRERLFRECNRLNRSKRPYLAFSLSRFLRNSEYRSLGIGIDKERLEALEHEWTERLLRDELRVSI